MQWVRCRCLFNSSLQTVRFSIKEPETELHTKSSIDCPVGPLLVIGYGNPLRSDDGVGPALAATVGTWQLPGVRSMVCHQLTPELVVPIAEAGQVVFVDASKDYSFVRLRGVEPAQSTRTMTHVVDPSSLLQLTKELYDRCPAAQILTIPAEKFTFGETLSDICRDGMQTALARIRVLATRRHQTGENAGSRSKKEKRLPTQAWRLHAKRGTVRKEP